MGMWRKGIRRSGDGDSRGERESEMKLRTLPLLDKSGV